MNRNRYNRNADMDERSLGVACPRCDKDVGVKCSNTRAYGPFSWEFACLPHPQRLESARRGPRRPAWPVMETCTLCQKDLAGENQDFVKLGWIKYRLALCNDDYQGLKLRESAP